MSDKTNITTVIGVDPGANGGIAIYKGDCDSVYLVKMPKSVLEFSDLLNQFDKNKTLLFIEKVGIRPDDIKVNGSEANMGKIYRIQKMIANYEALKTIIKLSEIPYLTIHPTKWQSALGVRQKGVDRSQRKRYFKQYAQKLYVLTKQTLWSADATLIMHCGRKFIKHNRAFILSKLPKHQAKILFR